MKNLIRAVAMTALPALVMSACSGGTNGTGALGGGLPSTSQAVRKPATALPTDLYAGGATFPAYGYNLASEPTGTYPNPAAGPGTGSLFASYGGTGTIYYCLTGSGFGRKVFDGATPANSTAACAALGQTATGFGGPSDPPDFVGSDVALASTEYTTYKTNREPSTGTNWGEPFEVPSIGGPIVFAYPANSFLPLVHAKQILHLSVWTYCAIANGTVKDWDDAAITKDNGGVSITKGVSHPITFYFRSDSSGTSFLFTTHLSTVCGAAWLPPYSKKPYQSATRNAAWTYGANSTWPGPGSSAHPNPNFIGENGNPGVLAGIQSNTYGTGYVEGAYAAAATHPKVHQAWLQNTQGYFADPTVAAGVKSALSQVQLNDVSYGEGSDNIQTATTRPDCLFYVNPTHFTNPPEAKAYPIVGVSYLLFYGNNSGRSTVHTADAIKLINFIESPAGNTITSGLEYSPLSKGLQNGIDAAANGTGNYTGKPCIQ